MPRAKASKSPLVSVLIPAWNAEKFIAATLKAVLSQTYENLEIIVVDDGSSDDTAFVVKDLAKTDKRIKLHGQENKGLAATRNVLFQLATGKYLHFLDADDGIDPNYYEECVRVAEQTGADLCVTGFETHKWKSSIYYGELRVETDLAEKIKAIGGLYLRSMVWRFLYRTDFIKRAGLEFVEGRDLEDLKFTPVALAKSDTLAVVPGVLYHYYDDNPDAITAARKGKNKKKFNADLKDAKKVLKDLDRRYALKGILMRNFVKEEQRASRPGFFTRILRILTTKKGN